MSDLLTGIRREISARLDELRPAVIEYTRLQEARAALTSIPSTNRKQPGCPTTYSRSVGSPGRASARRRKTQSVNSPSRSFASDKSKKPASGRGRPRTRRAARGANQAAVVATDDMRLTNEMGVFGAHP